VPADHDDDAPAAALRVGDGVGDPAKVAGDEDVGEGTEKRREGAVAPRRRGELGGSDLVRTAGDRNGPNGGEVGFAPVSAARGRALVR
jgi:hypothetical protein